MKYAIFIRKLSIRTMTTRVNLKKKKQDLWSRATKGWCQDKLMSVKPPVSNLGFDVRNL
jgi:hypothetical protein